MFKIIDDLLPESYLKNLQEYFLSQRCDWNFNNRLTSEESHQNMGSFGFVIRLHWNQAFVDNFAGNLCKQLIITSQNKVSEITKIPHIVVRARADMTLYNPEKYRHELHTDYSYEHTTAIFYLNSSDGNTLLFDREGEKLLTEVEPIENRLLIFDGLLQHTGHSPAMHKSRVLINMNFMTPELIDKLNSKQKR